LTTPKKDRTFLVSSHRQGKNMKKILYLTITLTMVFSIGIKGQMIDKMEVESAKKDYTNLKPAVSPFSLIDLSRVKWSHSYSVSYFSGGGYSGSQGLYIGSLFYEFSPSLSMNINLGIGHNPGAMFNSNLNSDARFYPSVNLDYHPSDNFRLHVGFTSYPGIYYNPYIYNNRDFQNFSE
jgi:hypothetical protein